MSEELLNTIARLERELEQARRSPHIDSDEDPVEILAAIHDALDGITDDAVNGHNFGTLLSRVKAAVYCARELEQARQDAKQSDLDAIRALGERNDARAELERIKAILADPLAVHLNMMRGEIKCTPANLRHLLGDCQPTPADD